MSPEACEEIIIGKKKIILKTQEIQMSKMTFYGHWKNILEKGYAHYDGGVKAIETRPIRQYSQVNFKNF